ncbi:hypothetical protein IX51_04925 [uncultured archaeon]|nr:hypothetical protein IX51_04925 [uncultured archaeon]
MGTSAIKCLIMNDTYEDYLKFLNDNLERVRESLLIDSDSPLRRLYDEAFGKNFIEKADSRFNPGSISATDSSEFVRELYNGKKLILIRAYAKTKNRTAKDFICEVMDVNRDEIRNFTILLMEHTEHVATLNLLKEEKPDYVLMDGSLAGRLRHKRNRIDAENYENFIEIYFRELYALLRYCIENGIPMAFVAKSSESLLFRNYLLDNLDRSVHTEDMIKSEREYRRTDHLLIKSFAKASGYTVPLKVSFPADRNELGQSRLNVVTLHALPDHNDLPIKVDLVLPEAQDSADARTAAYDLDGDIMEMIFWGYGGLKTHNIWLADVDRDVKFRQKEIEGLYMRTFESVVGVPFYETRGERRARIRI